MAGQSASAAAGRLHARPQRGRLPDGQRLPRHGVRQLERTDARAHQPLHGGPAAERRAEIGGQGPEVGALAAHHPETDVGRRDLLHLDGVDHHLAGLAHHLDALAGQLVEAAAAVVDGRVHRGHLLDAAQEGLAGRLHLRPVDVPDRRLGDHAAAHVTGVGGDAETQGRHVFLVLVGEVGHQLRRLAEQHGQHPGGVGVERAGVADTLEPEPAPDEGHGVEGGDPGRLVDDQDAGRAHASTAAPHRGENVARHRLQAARPR